MSLKALGLLAPVVLGGAWFAGVLGDSAYSRVVDRPPAQVMSALEDLDITAQPGSPGTDPARSGGIQPIFVTERGENSISFFVMSGNQVATRMTAFLEPLDGGTRTRVTAKVERGDAPDDFVSPAFRSTGITLGLFTMAIEGELNELVAPAAADPAVCQALMARFEQENMAAGLGNRPDNLKQGIGNTAQVVMRLNAMEAELRRNGCPTDRGGTFEPVSSVMGEGGEPPQGEVSFDPGRPMVDVRR